MITNPSDNAQTIQEAINSSEGHLWDTSNFFTYCSLKNITTMNDIILDDYKSILMQVLDEEPLDVKYYYNPGLYALDKYGSQNLDFIVMYFSGMYSVLDFNKTTIKYLPKSYIRTINQLLLNNRDHVKKSKLEPTIYDDLTIYEI